MREGISASSRGRHASHRRRHRHPPDRLGGDEGLGDPPPPSAHYPPQGALHERRHDQAGSPPPHQRRPCAARPCRKHDRQRRRLCSPLLHGAPRHEAGTRSSWLLRPGPRTVPPRSRWCWIHKLAGERRDEVCDCGFCTLPFDVIAYGWARQHVAAKVPTLHFCAVLPRPSRGLAARDATSTSTTAPQPTAIPATTSST